LKKFGISGSNCKPFGAPADPASATPLRIQYLMYYMRSVGEGGERIQDDEEDDGDWDGGTDADGDADADAHADGDGHADGVVVGWVVGKNVGDEEGVS